MKLDYQLLSWDSDVFGMPVAKILPERLLPTELEQLLNDLRGHQVQLVFWASDSTDASSQQAAKQANGFLADRKITYLCDLTLLDKSSEIQLQVESYPQHDPDEALLELGYLSGLYSRFRSDPKISEALFKKVYGLWMNNSTNRRVAKEVLVIKRQQKIVAMVTLGEKNDRGDIGLLAVDPQFQGQQLGTQLMVAAKAWCVHQGYKWGQVVTQQDNLPACALYEKCGYSVEKIENFYHFWLR